MTISRSFRPFLALLLLCAAAPALAVPEPPKKTEATSAAEALRDSRDWKKTEDENGLAIYEKKDESGFLAFRAEGEIEGSIRDVASAILDSEHTSEWVEHLEEDKILRRPAPGTYIEYTHVSTPFVLKDRDFVCEVNVKADEAAKTLSIESRSVEDASAPATKYVRGHVQYNVFRLSPGSKAGRARLEGEFHIDPKGTVPKWIVNLFQHAWPRKAFLAIQKRVKEGSSRLPKELEPVLTPVARW